MNKKGQVTIYVVFMIVAVFIVLVGAFFAPMGVLFNTEMVKAGEDILLLANDSLQSIQNQTVRNSIQSVVNNGFDNAQNNIEVNGAIFQYSWVLVLIVTLLVLFLFTRRLVEFGGGGLV